MADLNFSVRTGRFTDNPELKTSNNGKQFVKFTLAVNSRKEQADFFEYVAWDANARYIDRYVRKGTKVWISGNDKMNPYTDKNGVKRKSFITVCEKISIVESRAAQEAYEQKTAVQISEPHAGGASLDLLIDSDDEDVPF